MNFRNPAVVVILAVIALVIIAGASFLFMSQERRDQALETPTPTSPNVASPTPVVDTADWETYINEKENWQIDYPQEAEVATHSANQIGSNGVGNVVVFSHLGPTQAQGTELFDGYSVTVGLKSKPANQSLMGFAEQDSDPGEGIGERSDLESITINGHEGYETTVTSLGEARLIYLEYPVLETRVYYISIFSTAPGEREQEFDAIVETMLQSFRSYR
jgi:hypothetical protein